MDAAKLYGMGHTADTGAQSRWVPGACVPLNADNLVLPIGAATADVSQALLTASMGFAFAGNAAIAGNPGTVSRVRGANVFKNVSATAAGNTTVWAPSSSTRRWVLLGFTISVAGTIAVAGVLTVQLRDTNGGGGGPIWQGNATVAATGAAVGDTQMGADYGLFGLPAIAVNENLVVNLSVAMTAGSVKVNCWGTEET